MKLPSIIAIFLSAFLFAASSALAGNPPAFPGQPHINGALKHLHAAKEKASTDAPGALNELEAAGETLSHAIRNKGTFQNIAREYTTHASEYLKKGDVDKAVHNIDEAIAAVEKAGGTGTHER
jgi:tetratricopeptide (TPR) repeat protein